MRTDISLSPVYPFFFAHQSWVDTLNRNPLAGSETHDSHILLIPLFFPPQPVSGFVLDLCLRFLICNTVYVCMCLFCGLGPDVFLISVDERAKHDQQFHSLSPTAGGYITGNYHSHSLFLCPLSTHRTPLYGQGDMRTGTRTESFKVLSAWMHTMSSQYLANKKKKERKLHLNQTKILYKLSLMWQFNFKSQCSSEI